MVFTVGVAGKGGVGKTTVSALTIRWLAQRGTGPILAVDADPNANLNQSLGIGLGDSVGNIRESMKGRKGVPAGMSQAEFVDYKIRTSLFETEPYDFIAMGRPEGPGCYCYPNSMLKRAIERLSDDYAFLVMDNEAGLENLSRRLMQRIDLLLVVSDPTVKGIRTAGSIQSLARELEIRCGRVGLIINCMEGEVPSPSLQQEVESQGLTLLGLVPRDPEVRRRDEAGEAVYEVDEDSAVYRSLATIMEQLDLP